MYPDLYLLVEQVRGQELRAAARTPRRAWRARRGRGARSWERRLGWALVETGLRLVCRGAAKGPRLVDRHA
ncbi:MULTISPECIES: hypothetical protein [unclassified Nonomuraea]|uniref:hypothetical protein n=1 Tax=unclassified Nonomuraea TaxID=2593643 RepID=UPI0033E6FA74